MEPTWVIVPKQLPLLPGVLIKRFEHSFFAINLIYIILKLLYNQKLQDDIVLIIQTVCGRGTNFCRTSGTYLFGVSLHNLGVNVVCIECCEDGATDELCACAEIQTEEPEDSKFWKCCKNEKKLNIYA